MRRFVFVLAISFVFSSNLSFASIEEMYNQKYIQFVNCGSIQDIETDDLRNYLYLAQAKEHSSFAVALSQRLTQVSSAPDKKPTVERKSMGRYSEYDSRGSSFGDY